MSSCRKACHSLESKMLPMILCAIAVIGVATAGVLNVMYVQPIDGTLDGIER